MNAQEAEAAYRTAKSQLDSGQIGLDEFNRRMAELKYQDNTGIWWAISPADGSWLKWTGSAWVPAFAQAMPVTPQVPVQTAPQPAVRPAQQPAQPAEKPSWYIPPVSSGQQKPAIVQPVAQQPIQQPVQQPAASSYYIPPVGSGQKPAEPQSAKQPAAQPAASSYYIPPVGSSQQPPVQQPVQHPAVQPQATTGAVKPARNWAGIGSLAFGILSWILYPVILGFIAMIAGAAGIYLAKRQGSKIPVTAVIGIIAGLLSIILYIFWLDIFPPPEVLPPVNK